ncbi:hypothetical protein DDW06_02945 [Sulfolobales archaeon SCGC AB-777_K20]|nr:hypothetical protein DDW06_02945 [Sulfolobales archaeon SCGC AB-777_K20]
MEFLYAKFQFLYIDRKSLKRLGFWDYDCLNTSRGAFQAIVEAPWPFKSDVLEVAFPIFNL